MNKFKVGDTVKVISHQNEKMIGKVSTITKVLKDHKGVYLYKVNGVKDYATETDIENISIE